MDSWGKHLLLDAKDCNEDINDQKIVKQFLFLLVEEIEMVPLAPPFTIYVDDEDGKGVTGYQLIRTSHISFHGDDNGKRVFLDVFSCEDFDEDDVVRLFDRFFSPSEIKRQLIIR